MAVKKTKKKVKAAEPAKPRKKARKAVVHAGRPEMSEAEKKQRQQIFLVPTSIDFIEKIAKKLSRSRQTPLKATQLEAEILENWVKRQKRKLAMASS